MLHVNLELWWFFSEMNLRDTAHYFQVLAKWQSWNIIHSGISKWGDNAHDVHLLSGKQQSNNVIQQVGHDLSESYRLGFIYLIKILNITYFTRDHYPRQNMLHLENLWNSLQCFSTLRICETVQIVPISPLRSIPFFHTILRATWGSDHCPGPDPCQKHPVSPVLIPFVHPPSSLPISLFHFEHDREKREEQLHQIINS